MKNIKLMKKKHIQERKTAYKFLLAIPPIVALVMIAFVSFTHQAVIVAEKGIFLSPVKDSSPLILSLSIFIIGYLMFIGLLFKESLKQFVDSKIMHRN